MASQPGQLGSLHMLSWGQSTRISSHRHRQTRTHTHTCTSVKESYKYRSAFNALMMFRFLFLGCKSSFPLSLAVFDFSLANDCHTLILRRGVSSFPGRSSLLLPSGWTYFLCSQEDTTEILFQKVRKKITDSWLDSAMILAYLSKSR